MKIAVDAHGGDFGVAPNIEGALLALSRFRGELVFVGDEPAVRAELARLGAASEPRVKTLHAASVVDMAGEPVKECREKPDSTIMVCAGLVAKREADALVSAGNSGATMVASFRKIGRLDGIARPAIATPLPTVKGNCVLLDGGANTECRPQHLLQFAVMGSVYARHALGISNPTVGILSVGEEETKGNTLVKETIPLLKASGLNFRGPVEGRDIPFGTTDVVVCDGFVGNVVLKLYEGAGKAMFELIRSEIDKAGLAAKLGALMSKPAFRAVKERTDPDSVGGAPLLGVDGISIICHGRSGPAAMKNAVIGAAKLVESGANAEIMKQISQSAPAFHETEQDAMR